MLVQARTFSQTCLSEENQSLLLLGKPRFLAKQFGLQRLNLRWKVIQINVRGFCLVLFAFQLVIQQHL